MLQLNIISDIHGHLKQHYENEDTHIWLEENVFFLYSIANILFFLSIFFGRQKCSGVCNCTLWTAHVLDSIYLSVYVKM
jgi:hypothetical protein